MAFAELLCTCEAGLQLDIEDEEMLMTLVMRYAEQHVQCGWVAAAAEEPQTLRIRRATDDEYEDTSG